MHENNFLEIHYQIKFSETLDTNNLQGINTCRGMDLQKIEHFVVTRLAGSQASIAVMPGSRNHN